MAFAYGTSLEQSVDNILTGVVTTNSAKLCTALVPFAVVAITLYIMFTGYNIIFGKTSEPARDVLSRTWKIIFICALALTQGSYQSLVVDFFNGIMLDITVTLGNGASIGGLIDGMGNQLNTIFNNYDAHANILTNVMLVVVLFFYLLVTIILLISAFGYFLLTKIALAVLFAIGPIFIFLSIFPATQKFTESWIGQAIQYILLQILVVTVVTLVQGMVVGYAANLNASAASANPVDDLIGMIFVLLGCVIVFFNLNGIASALSGGVGLTGMSHAASNAAMRAFMGGRSPKTPAPNPNQIAKQSLLKRAASGLAKGAGRRVQRLYNAATSRG
jgi:type IV secretion system protein VirB6